MVTRQRAPWSLWVRRSGASAAYLAAEIAAGWLTWLFASTFVLLPVWAAVWAGAERRLVALAGLPPIRSRATGWTGRVRETAFALVAVGLLGTIVGAVTSPEEMNPMVQGVWVRLLQARHDSPGP